MITIDDINLIDGTGENLDMERVKKHLFASQNRSSSTSSHRTTSGKRPKNPLLENDRYGVGKVAVLTKIFNKAGMTLVDILDIYQDEIRIYGPAGAIHPDINLSDLPESEVIDFTYSFLVHKAHRIASYGFAIYVLDDHFWNDEFSAQLRLVTPAFEIQTSWNRHTNKVDMTVGSTQVFGLSKDSTSPGSL